jgi:microcompartment protein CcmL/EutN
MGIAVGIIELRSMARSFLVADRCMKTAPVDLQIRITCPGKSLLMMSGEISAVQSAVELGKR